MADAAIDIAGPIVDAGAVDIFISYSRGDRERIGVLAQHLQAKGLRVWWDPEIPPGEKFDRVIARALASCKIVLVAWSAHSIDSDWVLNEADEGRRRKILLPVLLDTVEIPLGFRRVQACDLRHWKGNDDHIELRRLLFRIARMQGDAPPDDGPPPDGPRPWPKYVAAGVLLTLLAGGGFGGWQWKQARDFEALIAAAEARLGSGDIAGAEQPITAAANLRSDHPALRALRTRLALARAQLVAGIAKPPPADAARDCADCPELIVIPAGEFAMGAEPGEEFYNPAQGPKHQVALERPFALGRFEVTVREYGAFVRDARYKPVSNDCSHYDFVAQTWISEPSASWQDPPIFPQQSAHPVVCVSWHDAQAYVAWLTAKTGKRYRLPTEAEWEYAARAGATGAWPWAKSQDACRHGNLADEAARARLDPEWKYHDCSDGIPFTAPVGRFLPNSFGLHDMIGNVWEWVEDCFVNTYERAPADGSAHVVAGCEQRVLRGGSWLSQPRDTRFAQRGRNSAHGRFYAVGFRVARDP